MSHIYQPVMIKALLLRNGKASKTEIAEEILRYDPSQVEYYESIVNNMVGRVLRNHDVVRKEKRLTDKLWEGKMLKRAEIEYIARKK